MMAFTPLKAEGLTHDLNQGVDSISHWEQGFNLYLLRNEDPNLQAYGLYYLSSFGLHGQSDLNDSILSEYKKVMAALLEDNSLDAQSMFLLLTTCYNGKTVEDCDYLKVSENLMQFHSDNMASFLFALNQAQLNEVEGEVISLVRNVANATFVDEYLHVSEAYAMALSEYVEKQPLPESAFKYETDLFLGKESLTATELQSLQARLGEYHLFMYKNMVNLQLPIPAFKALIDTCKGYPELYDDCMSISEVFIQSGHWIPEMLGHRIQINLFEISGNSKAHELAVARKSQLKETINCLVNASRMPSLFKLDLEHAYQRMQVTQEKGERAGMYHYAKLKYQEAAEQGDPYAESLNPDLCVVEE